MADFDPPFAQNGEFRFPNANEQSLGWPCGPTDQALLSGLFRLHNGNIGEVIREAGVTGQDGDLTKLVRAIRALIIAEIGEADPGTAGDLSQLVLMAQARNRLPIFPDVQNADGRIGVTAPSTGTVRLAGGVEFLHRGIFRVTTTQTDFATDPSRTYHLRWTPTDGFALRDLASGSYNPGTLSEANVAFDSTYDDMLIARVITNSSNVATITTLRNSDRWSDVFVTERGRDGPYQDNISDPANVTNVRSSSVFDVNLARAPNAALTAALDIDYDTTEANFGVHVMSRYRVRAFDQIKGNGANSSIAIRVWL